MARELDEQLEALQKNFAGLAKTLGSTSKSLLKNSKDGETFSRTQKVLNKSLADYQKKNKGFVFGMESFGEAMKAAKKDIKGFRFNLKAIPSPMGLLAKGLKIAYDATIGLGVAMVKTAVAMSDATKQFKGLEDVVDAGAAELAVVGGVAKELAKDIDLNVGVFRTLAQTGASFGSSIVSLRKAQEDAQMPLTKFTQLITDNSVTLAKLFGSVDQGIPQITGFMRGLRDMTMDEFAKFGLTLDETSTFLGTFLELERARGNTTKMTQDQLLAGTRAYTKDLVLLSKLTGESVDELNNQNMAMAADGVFQSQLQGMAAEDAKTLSLGVGALPGPLKQLAKEFIGLGAPISQTSRELEAMSGGAFGDAIKQFQNTGDLVAFQNSIKTISGDVMKNSEAFGDAALAGGGFGEALNAVAASIGTAVDEADITGELNAAGDNIAKVLNLTTGELDKTKEALETFRFKGLDPFIFSGEKAGKGITKLAGLLEKARTEGIDKMGDIARKMGQYLMGEKVTTKTEFKDSPASLFNFKKMDGLDYLDFNLDGGIGVPGINEMPASKKYGTGHLLMNNGSDGFKDFGSGTPATLHGIEAVVPKNDFSQLAKVIKEMTGIGGATPPAGNDMQSVNAENYLRELVELNKNAQRALNTLVTVSAMTEKNTKSMNNNVANMGGSLV